MSRPSSTSAPTVTIATTPTKEGEEEAEQTRAVGTLRLRGAPRKNRPSVAWDEDVVDNEGCGKKNSKVCCIFHKPRRFDESSSSESDSDSDSDSDSCDGHDHRPHQHDLNGDEGSTSRPQQLRSEPSTTKVHELSEDEEPNAYERIPSSRKGKGKGKGKRHAA